MGLRAIGLGLAWAFLATAQAPGILAQDEGGPGGEWVLFYPIRGVLTRSLASSIREEIEGELKKQPGIRTIVLEIDSPGTERGRLEPAEETVAYLKSLRGVRVVAKVEAGKFAGNASALIAIAAQDLVMAPASRLGFRPNTGSDDLEVPDASPEDAEKARMLFKNNCGRGPIGKSRLASAMVSRHHPPIFKVRFEQFVGNQAAEDEVRFLTPEEVENLAPVDKHRQRLPDDKVVPPGQPLTLDARKALEYGFATKILETDDHHEVLHKLGITVGDEHVIVPGGVVKPNDPSVQTIVDFFDHPFVRFLLLLVGTLGMLIEFKMPGTLVPALVSIISFSIFFITGLYDPSGGTAPTNVWEILLFVIGLGLIGVELFFLPGVLLFGLLGAGACLTSIVLALVPSSGTTVDYQGALTTLIVSNGASVLIFLALLRILPRTRFGRKGLVIHSSIQGTPTSDSVVEDQSREAGLIGKVAMAVTPLRPSGTVELDGKRIDVVAESDFVERGEQVRILEIDGTRTVVKRI